MLDSDNVQRNPCSVKRPVEDKNAAVFVNGDSQTPTIRMLCVWLTETLNTGNKNAVRLWRRKTLRPDSQLMRLFMDAIGDTKPRVETDNR
jgi:hypothetical protein